MINFNKSAIVLLIAAGTALAAVPSQAQGTQTAFASITGITAGTSNSSSVFTYTPGTTGGFSITSGALFSAQFLGAPYSTTAPVNVTFTGLNNVGTLLPGTTGFTQELSGGSFNVVSGGTSLLNGTFGGGNLLGGTPGSTTSALTNTLTNVIFTGGTYFNQSGLYNPGSFSISLQGVAPPISANGSYFNGFQSAGTGSFTASSLPPAVPEPATIVPFLVGGLGLLALAVRKTRKAASITA